MGRSAARCGAHEWLLRSASPMMLPSAKGRKRLIVPTTASFGSESEAFPCQAS